MGWLVALIVVIVIIIIVAIIIALNKSSDSAESEDSEGEGKDKKEAKEVEWKDLNEDQKFVVDGAIIKCLFNSIPYGELKVTANDVKLQDKDQATIADKKKENIMFKGPCMHPSQQKPSAPPPPCQTVIKLGDWKSFSETKINDDKALLKKSTLPCLISQRDITIFHSGQKSEPPLEVPYETKPKIKIKAIKAEYTVVLKADGTAHASHPILEFEISDGEPGYFVDIQVVRKNKTLLTNNKGIVDSWQKALPLLDRMKKEAYSSWSTGHVSLCLDSSGKVKFQMPLDWWQDLARTPLADFTTMPICFKVSAFEKMEDIVPLVETDSSDKMSVNVHNNLVEFKVDDHGYIDGGVRKSVTMKFTVKEANTTEMYTIVQWNKGSGQIWDAAKNKSFGVVTDYNLNHRFDIPEWSIDRLRTNPRYGDGNYTISGDGKTATTSDKPGGQIPTAMYFYYCLDFETKIYLNFEVPANVSIKVQEGSPPVYDKLIGVISPPEPFILATRSWNARILHVKNSTTGNFTVTHPNIYAGP